MKRKGITLLEIVLVLTLLTIVSAIILPNFDNTSDKFKLKADINSAKILQSAIDLYNIQESKNMSSVSNNIDSIITELYDKKYLKQNTLILQTADSKFEIDFNNNIIKIDISANALKDKIYDELTEQEKYYVIK